MRSQFVTVFLLAASVTACGAKGGGSSDPDGVGKAFVAAINSHDKEAIKAIFPSDELLKKSIDCGRGSGLLTEHVAGSRDGLASKLDKDLKDVTFEWVGQEPKDETLLNIGVIEDWFDHEDGCKALVKITSVDAKWSFKITKGGKTEEQSQDVKLVKLGAAGWFLFHFPIRYN